MSSVSAIVQSKTTYLKMGKIVILLLATIYCIVEINAMNRVKREEYLPPMNHIEKKLLAVLKTGSRPFVHVKLNLEITDIHAMHFVSRSAEPVKQLVHTGKTCVVNKGNIDQEGQTDGYKRTITNVTTVTITNTRDLTGEAKIPIGDLSKLSVKFGHSETSSEAKSIAIEKVIPPQKVKVLPRTKITVFYEFHKVVETEYYLADLVIGSESFMHSSLWKSGIGSVVDFILVGLTTPEDFRLINFLTERPRLTESLRSDNQSEPSLIHENEKYIMKNYPMTIQSEFTEVKVVYGHHQTLSDSELNGEVQC